MSLKQPLYNAVYKREQRTSLITTFVLVLFLINLAHFIPLLKEQKADFHKLELTDELFNHKQYKYREFLDWTYNMDEVIAKKQVIEGNTLHKKDPNNYKYIEYYISERLKEIWLPEFRFNSVYNFRNSWRNSVILDITLTDKEKLTSFISKVSQNWFLWKNVTILKEWDLYKWNIELVFDIK